MTRRDYAIATGRWMAANRALLGMTQMDLARALHAAEGSVSNWEAGKGSMSAYMHQQLRQFFRLKGGIAWKADNYRTAKMSATKRAEVTA